MRIRKKKYTEEVLSLSKNILIDKEYFIDSINPIHLEIGVGRGDFIIGMAKKNQSINFLGIELETNVIAVALKKILQEDNLNIKLFNINAADLGEYIKNKIDIIYLNFSDPWPKKKQIKRRLTSDKFIEIYKSKLNVSGKIIFKSDNENLYHYSLEQFEKHKFKIIKNEDYQLDENDVMTEYEKKFRSAGLKIYRIIAIKE